MNTGNPPRRRRATTFRQRDMTRAVKAVVGAGVPVARVEVDKDGKIAIVTGQPESDPGRIRDLDSWLAKHARAA